MPRILRAVLISLVLAIVFSFTSFYSECDDIRGKVLRLHVLANSDSKQDQELKLKVRDTIIGCSAGMFDTSINSKEAYEIAKSKLLELEQSAQQRVFDEGFTYKVDVDLTEMYFTTRQYEHVTLPAGNYDALRVTIGDAEGENWWCVVFPPMCVSAATQSKELADVLEPKQEEIVTESDKYEVKFKFVEIFENFGNTINKMFS